MRLKLFLLLLGAGALLPLAAFAVTVGPVRLEYTVDPGSSFSGNMFVVNEGQETQTFYASFERFTEENGQKIFTKETSDLSTWFRMDSSVSLKAGEQRAVPFTIEVPRDAAPGGHFAVIWWSTSPPGLNPEHVAIVTRAGVLVYLRVTGDIKENADIQEFRVGSLFSTKTPVTFALAIKDTGNVSLKPTGSIRIRNLFGWSAGSVAVNKDQAIILPQTQKVFNPEWSDSNIHFGIYRAELAVQYGDSKKSLSDSAWFILVTPKGTAIFILVLFLIFAAPYIIRRYNRWVIKRSQRG